MRVLYDPQKEAKNAHSCRKEIGYDHAGRVPFNYYNEGSVLECSCKALYTVERMPYTNSKQIKPAGFFTRRKYKSVPD